MVFLRSIERLRGEEQSSSVLKQLLLNSYPFRNKLIKRIKKSFAPTGIPTFDNGVTCFTEFGENVEGRLIFFLVADNAVLIIENKLWHSFEDRQPVKYEESIRKIAEETFRRQPDQCQVIVLFPLQRKDYIKEELDRQNFAKKPILITWQEIQEDIESTRSEDSEANRVIGSMLSEYLDQVIGEYAELDIPKEDILGDGVRIGNQFQRDFINRLESGFNRTSNIRFGKQYGGFYFRFFDEHDHYQNWFGFHLREGIVRLEFHVNFENTPLTQDFDENCFDTLIYGMNERSAYAFDFDPWPRDRAEWQEALDKILVKLQKNTIPPAPADTELDKDQSE